MGGNPLKSSRTGAGLSSLGKDASWRLCLLVAPSGAGKTSALRRWASRQAAETDIRLAWLSLRPEHNQPERFLDDMNACLGIPHFIPGSPVESEAGDGNKIAMEEELVKLINELARSSVPAILVIDNYELIQNPSIHDGVKLLVDYLPPQVRLVIASQQEPPLQQAKLRARRQLFELGHCDLQEECSSI